MFTDASFAVLIPAGAGIFNLLCIRYALRPRVSSRLTLGGRTWPRKPWVYGDQDFHLVYRYSCPHPHWPTLHSQLPSSFTALVTLPYRSPAPRRSRSRSFGIGFDRQSFSARHRSMSQLLRGLISLSLLLSSHLRIFQHPRVRSSTWCYPGFNLLKSRSPPLRVYCL